MTDEHNHKVTVTMIDITKWALVNFDSRFDNAEQYAHDLLKRILALLEHK